MANLLGKPLLEWTLDAAHQSTIADKVFVSSESNKILNYSQTKGATPIKRPSSLLGETPIFDVYQHAAQHIKKVENLLEMPIIVGLQPDHPDRTVSVDQAVTIFLENELDELFSCDSKGTKNGSFFIISSSAFEGKKSKKTQIIVDDCTNIHTEADLKLAANKMMVL